MIDYTGLTFQHLQYFITISEQGTMSRAAEILHVSPSLLSQKISQLENIIGIQLFRRLKQRLYLTEAGQQLLMDFRDILFQLNRALDSAREQYSITRPLTIGFTNYQSSRSVEIFLEELHKRFPIFPYPPRFCRAEDFWRTLKTEKLISSLLLILNTFAKTNL